MQTEAILVAAIVAVVQCRARDLASRWLALASGGLQ